MADFGKQSVRSQTGGHDNGAVSFGERVVASQSFGALFHQGMGLVEQTAAYLDGPGRGECKALTRAGALAYATESMRLTTRLMQLASWLLLQRAVNEGELTQNEAAREKAKVDLGRAEVLDEEQASLLPERLLDLVEDTRELQQRILRLDAALYRTDAAPAEPNPVGRQLGLLRAAFEAR